MDGKGINGLQLYSTVEGTAVEWLWYPYIPYGKITVLQGDPGNGKSTLAINLIAVLSKGKALPGGTQPARPMNIIYQCSEDSISDTIKPRLLAAGADCKRVAFIREDNILLTMDDEKFRQAIVDFSAKLVVIDPVQAYLGDADLSNANSIRKIMRRLAMWAETYGCAIVLVGHLNKKESTKDLYRSLGSIDIMAAARSVLQIDCDPGCPETRVLHQIKNSLAVRGADCCFTIRQDGKLNWESVGTFTARSDCGNTAEAECDARKTKQEEAAIIIKSLLKEKPQTSGKVLACCRENGIGRKTTYIVKQILGVKSVKVDKQWYWKLPAEAENG